MLVTENENLAALFRELDWFQQVIDQVIRAYFHQEGPLMHWKELPLPKTSNDSSVYARIIRAWDLGQVERLALALSLAPHLRPDLLDVFFSENERLGRGFTEFGGMIDKSFSGFLPTGQTLHFLVTATDPLARQEVADVLSPDSRLRREQVLTLESSDSSIPAWSGLLSLSDLWLRHFLTGEPIRPETSVTFPAHRITTPLEWDDLVLDDLVMEQIEEIQAWLQHGPTLMNDWELARQLKAGYRALFYGPPGTGKTLTASLLGKSSGREVYRVDLSMIVSKYIGETEKNLSRVFDAAAYKDWILFFDEADALFGKRTVATTSNDRHANQQTGYLLQRIEDFPGVVILATNLKSNLDEAFSRRFQAMVAFTMPGVEERLRLWQTAFSGRCQLHPEVDLNDLAERYELAGGAIINVLRTTALLAITRGDTQVQPEELLIGLRREFAKDNKTL